MTAFIRSLCLAAVLAAGSAWAQQQEANNPTNPHSTKAKDKQTSGTTSQQQIDQGQTKNPDNPASKDAQPSASGGQQSSDAVQRNSEPKHPQYKDRDQVGSGGGMESQKHEDHDAMMTNASPQMQLMKLHKVNLHEIEAGKLAEQNGSDRVKSYARALQRDHQDADKQVMDLAKRKNINLSDAAMSSDKQQMSADKHQEKEMKKDRLSSLKGPEFDREFADQMAQGHQKVITLARSWTQNCKDKDVCNLLEQMMPTLQRHKDMADQLKAPAAQGRAPEKTR